MRKFLMIASAAVLFASAATASSAADHTWQVGPDAFNVHLDDLNLRTASDRAEALVRIEAAAARLCRKAGPLAARKECRSDVVARVARLPGHTYVQTALAERAQAEMRLAQAK